MLPFADVLQKNPCGVFATHDGDKISTRVFQLLWVEGNKVYFSTGNHKPVFEQMKKNPNVSFCTYAQGFDPVVSVNGKAVFFEDDAMKQRVLDEYPNIKNIYQSVDNPVFQLMYIDVEEVQTFSYSEGAKIHKV